MTIRQLQDQGVTRIRRRRWHPGWYAQLSQTGESGYAPQVRLVEGPFQYHLSIGELPDDEEWEEWREP